MTSLFTWIDHSESHRRKMLDVIDLFREQGTRDELGVSVIRDGFADLLFPGTGALQTRARYFLFIPWMFRLFEQERVRSSEIARRARAFEVRLIDAILALDDTRGAIGKRARTELRRMPSSIYWGGMRRLGILLFPGSQDDYYRSLDAWYRNGSRLQRTDDGEPVGRVAPNWHPALPPPPGRFEALAMVRAEAPSVPLALEPAEGEYLADRIRASVPDSLFAWFLDQLAEEPDAPFAWAHPLAGRLPPHLARQVSHARAFSELIAGAPLLYNGMVFEAPPRRDELHEQIAEDFRDWFNEIRSRSAAFDAWDRADFWRQVRETGARPSAGARAFVDRWIDLVLGSNSAAELWDSTEARALIRNRELGLKKNLARLDNQHARETLTAPIGTGRMDFRWGDGVDILTDILDARRRN